MGPNKNKYSVLKYLIFALMLGCNGSHTPNDEFDDFDDVDDIEDPAADELVYSYTNGSRMRSSLLDPNYLSKKRLSLHFYTPLTNENEEVYYNIKNRVRFDTEMVLKSNCLYRNTYLQRKNSSIYFYDTKVNDLCRPQGDQNIDHYEEREIGWISFTDGNGNTVSIDERNSLQENLTKIFRDIEAGDRIDINHKFNNSLMMDYEDANSLLLRKFRLSTHSTQHDNLCEANFNSFSASIKIDPCVRQIGVRVWNRNTGDDGINDFVKLSNFQEILAEEFIGSQKWFNESSTFDLIINDWQGNISYFDHKKRESPLVSLENPAGKYIEYRPTNDIVFKSNIFN